MPAHVRKRLVTLAASFAASVGCFGSASADDTSTSSRIQTMIADAWADATETWSTLLGALYQMEIPQINFVTAVRPSHCYGLYISAGPVYCSGNTTVFVSVTSMQDLEKKIPGVGDAGLAFLVAHELGHHVQKITGRFPVFAMLLRANPRHSRELALRFELEADCLAGVWANNSPKFAATAGAREAMLASLSAIGDDVILGANGGSVDPATFTHGTSEQRVRWFKSGLASGQPGACDVMQSPDF